MTEDHGRAEGLERLGRSFPGAEAATPTAHRDPPPWVGVVANRGSGSGQARRAADRFCRALESRGLAARVAWTPEERSLLVRAGALDPACRCLTAIGGDGTFASLINENPTVPLAILPTGTENLAARHFGSKCDPVALARRIATAEPIPIDLGLAQGRRFVLMAGFGFDGDVVTRHHRSRVSHAGRIRPTHRMAYVQPILESSFSYPFSTITVQVLDPGREQTLHGTTVFIFNLPRYALGLPFAPQARGDDGWLDLLIFREPGPFQAFYYLCKVFLGCHLGDPGVTHLRVKKVVVAADRSIPVQLDGDPAGFLEPTDPTGPNGLEPAGWTIEVLPAAARVYSGDLKQSSTPVALAVEAGKR